MKLVTFSRDGAAPRAGALVDEAHHRVDRLAIALEVRLDRAVVVVAHPAAHVAGVGAPAGGLAEEHPLDGAVDDDAAGGWLGHGGIVARGTVTRRLRDLASDVRNLPSPRPRELA